MIVKAYAKVNISLKILGKRPDGYHELISQMQSLPDLYDVLEIVESDETEITCSDSSLSCGPDNLVYKALDAMGKKAKVHIEKHIPIAAGLAGGSADAAAVIYAFLGPSEKAEIVARGLGSDVPFSLLAIRKNGHAAAMARGTGQDLEEIEEVKGKIITFTPNIPVSTPSVYAKYDQMKEEGILPEGNANDLQAPAIAMHPEILDALDELIKKYGNGQQSGSGPSCFAIVKED